MVHEEKRKIPIKFIIHSQGWFMCKTNWSKSYSAGVEEFANENDALAASNDRNVNNVEVYGFNEFGERIQ